ncbi:MAG: tRNA preQ1(34) S-adenosylmethionine ribosyltransferase-isomerase QueA [Candidatus Paceibacterota bacterium]
MPVAITGMLLSDLTFELPEALIAQNPVEPRDAARLLVYNRKDRSIAHHHVRDLPSLLPPHTLLVANKSKVRKSRLFATRTDGRTVELLVLSPISKGQYECMVRGKKIKKGETFTLPNGGTATVVRPHEEAAFTTYILDFHQESDITELLLEKHGSTPLPPYITESKAPDKRYQTVFADDLGSAAAPTAGLHFTSELIENLKQQGNEWEEVVLHVGMGTFQPLREENIAANSLHHERTFVTEEAASRITKARQQGHAILAVGTTSCRTLESHASNGLITPGSTNTNLFIYPGYTFQATNLLLTNFHLPKSSLLLLVASLIGADPASGKPLLTPSECIAEIQRIYKTAIADQYRFFSYGDAMLVL